MLDWTANHTYIAFSLSRPRDTNTLIAQQSHAMRVIIRKLDIEDLVPKFNKENLQLSTSVTVEETVDAMCNYLVVACDASMLRRPQGHLTRRPVRWWNNNIAELSASCIGARRYYIRIIKRIGRNWYVAEREKYRTARKSLSFLISLTRT